MHIEQARVLQDTGNRIGLVTAIAGYVHADVIVHGRGDHAGATPMDFRLDPTLPLAETIVELERLARAAGEGTVGTVGEIEVDPGIINAIAARLRFSLDIRGPVDDAYRGVAREIAAFAERGGRAARDDAPSTASGRRLPPTPMDERIVAALEDAAQATGEPYMRMHSGAAHDTMCVADRVPTAMVFVPCKDGISHHPAEDADPADAALAAEIILNAIQALCARVGDQAAGEQDLPLARAQLEPEPDLAVRRGGDDLALARAHGLGQPVDPPLVALLDPGRPRPRGRAAGSPGRSGSCGGSARSSSRPPRGRRGGARRTRPARGRSPGRSCGRRRRSRRPTPPPGPGTRGRSAGTCAGRRRGCSTRSPARARRPGPCRRSRRRPGRRSARVRRSTRAPAPARAAGRCSPLLELDPAPVGRRVDDLPVVELGSPAAASSTRRLAEPARVGDLAAQRRRRRGRRRAQVDPVARRAAPAGEVAVERPHGDGARGGRLAHADARAAGRLEHARPGGEQVRVDARRGRSCRGSAATRA